MHRNLTDNTSFIPDSNLHLQASNIRFHVGLKLRPHIKFTGNVWTMQISLVVCLGRLSISYADLQSRHSAGFNSGAKGLGTHTLGKSWASLQRRRHIRSLQKLSPFLKASCPGTTFSTSVSVMQILQKKKLRLFWMQALASMTTILTNNSHWKVQDKIRDLPYECEKKQRPKS
jgi:hypothetical protein